jgi:hypothetical protein
VEGIGTFWCTRFLELWCTRYLELWCTRYLELKCARNLVLRFAGYLGLQGTEASENEPFVESEFYGSCGDV